jgi:hypothetical protein
LRIGSPAGPLKKLSSTFDAMTNSFPETSTLYEGKHLRLVRCGHWEYAERTNANGAVMILAVTDDDKVILIEQYRLPLNKPVIELPAGLAGDIAGQESEAMATAAHRELLEETGYEARELVHLLTGPPSAVMVLMNKSDEASLKLCSALATAECSNFKTGRAAAFLEKAN